MDHQEPTIQKRIIKLRNTIREHRDQRGDDRCWVDDFVVWSTLKDSSTEQTVPPPYAIAMQRCQDFWNLRRAETADPATSATVTDRKKWDQDLNGMTTNELQAEQIRLEAAIHQHRDISGRPRTLEDDRELYGVLPEKVPADFRLPPKNEFLGEALTPHAGCPSFWRSHANCVATEHNLHQWGPCK